MLYLALIALLALLGYGAVVYSGLATVDQAAARARGNLEFLLKQRDGELARQAGARPGEDLDACRGRIAALERAIADRRDFYNDEVNRYNALIGRFPGTLAARVFAFAPREPLA